MNKVKVKYDKRLKKYHINYEHLKEKEPFRFNYFKDINNVSDIIVQVETHLGSSTNPDPATFARNLEKKLTDLNLRYSIKPIEVRQTKGLFGIINVGGKKKINDFSITFLITKDTLTEEIFDATLREYDSRIGYNLLKDNDVLFEDILKGYMNPDDPSEYFGENLYDSRLFNKFLSTEDRT